MAEQMENRRRVAPAGMIARGAAAALDDMVTAAVGSALVLVTLAALGVVGEVTQREVGLTPTARGVLLGTIVAVTALLHASWDAGAGGPIRRSIGLRVVDATTYASIGVVRALFRVAAREFVFVTMVIGTSTFVGDRLPAPGPRQAWFVAGWLAACRVVPLAAAWYLPRGRGAHDLIARTIVIQAGPTTMPPIVEPVLLARRPALVRS